MKFIDSHCHLLQTAAKSGRNVAELLDEAREASVHGCLNIATTIEDATLARSWYQEGRLWLTAGVHPLNLDDDPQWKSKLPHLLEDGVYCAVGETGLDYHYHKEQEARAKQRQAFAAHLELARTTARPVIVHCRDAFPDVMAMVRDADMPEGHVVIHCFSEDARAAEAFLEAGCTLSFSGIVTFRNAESIRDAVQVTPLERLLVETDSPYLAPVPHRGKINRPAWVVRVAETIAQVKEQPLDTVARQTTANFERVFGVELAR